MFDIMLDYTFSIALFIMGAMYLLHYAL